MENNEKQWVGEVLTTWELEPNGSKTPSVGAEGRMGMSSKGRVWTLVPSPCCPARSLEVLFTAWRWPWRSGCSIWIDLWASGLACCTSSSLLQHSAFWACHWEWLCIDDIYFKTVLTTEISSQPDLLTLWNGKNGEVNVAFSSLGYQCSFLTRSHNWASPNWNARCFNWVRIAETAETLNLKLLMTFSMPPARTCI